jgi:hypothetical protein
MVYVINCLWRTLVRRLLAQFLCRLHRVYLYCVIYVLWVEKNGRRKILFVTQVTIVAPQKILRINSHPVTLHFLQSSWFLAHKNMDRVLLWNSSSLGSTTLSVLPVHTIPSPNTPQKYKSFTLSRALQARGRWEHDNVSMELHCPLQKNVAACRVL